MIQNLQGQGVKVPRQELVQIGRRQHGDYLLDLHSERLFGIDAQMRDVRSPRLPARLLEGVNLRASVRSIAPFRQPRLNALLGDLRAANAFEREKARERSARDVSRAMQRFCLGEGAVEHHGNTILVERSRSAKQKIVDLLAGRGTIDAAVR
jgi:hypothetical protein